MVNIVFRILCQKKLKLTQNEVFQVLWNIVIQFFPDSLHKDTPSYKLKIDLNNLSRKNLVFFKYYQKAVQVTILILWLKIQQHIGWKLMQMSFLEKTRLGGFWAERGRKWDQNEIFVVLSKFNVWIFFDVLHEVTVAERLRTEVNDFLGINLFWSFSAKKWQ